MHRMVLGTHIYDESTVHEGFSKTITKNVKEKIYLLKNNNGFVLVKCFLRLCDVVVSNVAKQSDRYIVNGFFRVRTRYTRIVIM